MSKVSKFLKVVMLSVCCFVSISLISCSKEKQDNPNQNRLGQDIDEKKRWEGSIDDDFTDDKVLIAINEKYHNYRFTEKDFPGLSLEKIKCVTEYAYAKYSEGSYPDNFHHIYVLTLKNKSKENVVKSIRICEEFDFVDFAEPNMIYNILDTFVSEE